MSLPDINNVRAFHQSGMCVHRESARAVEGPIPTMEEIEAVMRRPFRERVRLLEMDPVNGPTYLIDECKTLRPYVDPLFRMPAVIEAQAHFQNEKKQIETHALAVSEKIRSDRFYARGFLVLSSAILVGSVIATSWLGAAVAIATACVGLSFFQNMKDGEQVLKDQQQYLDKTSAQLEEMEAMPAQLIAEERDEMYQKGFGYACYNQAKKNILLPQEISAFFVKYLNTFVEKFSSRSPRKEASKDKWVKDFISSCPFSMTMIEFAQLDNVTDISQEFQELKLSATFQDPNTNQVEVLFDRAQKLLQKMKDCGSPKAKYPLKFARA